MSRTELADTVNAALDRLYPGRNLSAHYVDSRWIGKLERGEHRWPSEERRTTLRHVLGAATDTELHLYSPRRTDAAMSSIASPDADHVELLRQSLQDALTEGPTDQAGVNEWERIVALLGRATRDSPANVLLDDLIRDLGELKRALRRHRSASTVRRLTRVAAQMSGLMCLTFCRMDNRSAFRTWSRTARLAADESGDPATYSWVLAQEAYGHYYGADLARAVKVAQQAQELTARTPCVGSALAAALEARAHGAMQRSQQTRRALGRAEEILSNLDDDALVSSAFGYNEAQFRFHESNAYTHLGDTRSAFRAQDRALQLCAPGDYTDWAMTRLDRSHCIATAGEISDAIPYAIETLTALSEPQRRGIITSRGYNILRALPPHQQAMPEARDLLELLMLTTKQKETVAL